MGPRLSKNLQSRFQPPYFRITSAPRNRSPAVSMASFSRTFLPLKLDVAQALIRRGERAVGGFGGGGKPAFVDAAAVRAQSVEIARVELETSAGHQESAGNPAGGEADNAFAGGQGVEMRSVGCIGYLRNASCSPPSTGMMWPVVFALSSPASQTMAAAQSFGRIGRLRQRALRVEVCKLITQLFGGFGFGERDLVFRERLDDAIAREHGGAGDHCRRRDAVHADQRAQARRPVRGSDGSARSCLRRTLRCRASTPRRWRNW